MSKKLLTLLFTMVFAAAFVACGDDGPSLKAGADVDIDTLEVVVNDLTATIGTEAAVLGDTGQTVEYAFTATSVTAAPKDKDYKPKATATFTATTHGTYKVWARTAKDKSYKAGAVKDKEFDIEDSSKEDGADVVVSALAASFNTGTLKIDITTPATAADESTQTVEYAISTSGTVAPTGGFAAGPAFDVPGNALGTYYVWARTASNETHKAGDAKVGPSVIINTPVNRDGADVNAVTASLGALGAITITPTTVVAPNTGAQVVEYAIGHIANPADYPGTGAEHYTWYTNHLAPELKANANGDWYVYARAKENTVGIIKYVAGTAKVSAKMVVDDLKDPGGYVSGSVTTLSQATFVTGAENKKITFTADVTSTNAQNVQYAIGTVGTDPHADYLNGLDWIDGTTAEFVITGNGTYYIYARTAENTNNVAGDEEATTISVGITVTDFFKAGSAITEITAAHEGGVFVLKTGGALVDSTTGQSLEYAVTKSDGSSASDLETLWNSDITKLTLDGDGTYYLYVRAAMKENATGWSYDPGAFQKSTGIVVKGPKAMFDDSDYENASVLFNTLANGSVTRDTTTFKNGGASLKVSKTTSNNTAGSVFITGALSAAPTAATAIKLSPREGATVFSFWAKANVTATNESVMILFDVNNNSAGENNPAVHLSEAALTSTFASPLALQTGSSYPTFSGTGENAKVVFDWTKIIVTYPATVFPVSENQSMQLRIRRPNGDFWFDDFMWEY